MRPQETTPIIPIMVQQEGPLASMALLEITLEVIHPLQTALVTRTILMEPMDLVCQT